MSEVQRHRRPIADRWKSFKVRAGDFTDSRWFDFAAVVFGILVALLCVGGAVWAVQQGNDPEYQPDTRISYMRSQQ